MDKANLRDRNYFAEAVRNRPAMYVGSTQLFGFINYLVCPFALLLGHGARRISATIDEAGIHIDSDALIPVRENGDRLAPFEEIDAIGAGHGFEGTVLNALSERLTVAITVKEITERLFYERGQRKVRESVPATDAAGTSFHFVPDSEVFETVEIPPSAMESYFRRLSFLHAGVTFSLKIDGSERSWKSSGIPDLFAAIASPYQIMHEPIHVIGSEGKLKLEVVMAFQSWVDDHLWCFINNGRAVLGGTHEKGFRKAFRAFRKQLSSPERRITNGIVAVASIHYPDAVWEGCIKQKIGNPELESMVSQLILQETRNWLERNSRIADQLAKIQIFHFPESWSG